MADVERFTLPEALSRMDLTIDRAVWRFWEEIWMEARIMSMGFGGFGSWVWEREDLQVSGKRVALHAWRISAETGSSAISSFKEDAGKREKKEESRKKERRR